MIYKWERVLGVQDRPPAVLDYQSREEEME